MMTHHIKVQTLNWFLEHYSEFTTLRWPPTHHLCDVVEEICIVDVQ